FGFRATTAGLALVDGGQVALGSITGPIRLLDPITLKEVRRIDAPPGTTERLLAVDGGKALIGSGANGEIRFDLDSHSSGPTWRAGLNGMTGGECDQLVVREEAGDLYCGS